MLGGLALGIGGAGGAAAQQPRQPDQAPAATAPATTPRDTAAPTDRRDAERSSIVDASALETGANSFTEGQARARLEDAGFTNLQDLRKDDAGFWRARAMRAGASTEVALDFRGRIAAGPGVANLGAGRNSNADRAGPAATPRADSSARPDGTPGNPPSTATGRAVDRAQGETPRADGTPGNPPGTAAGRALDRATGSNTTGANPTAPAPATGGTTR
ncbi:hypothetical protein [Falsiroseomonas sp. HW251]|uniref:hypothetical protein n=1 Tax=Falsiroseomonas sp. HW251 TaxID=3390998 RepID=UPI003D3191C7